LGGGICDHLSVAADPENYKHSSWQQEAGPRIGGRDEQNPPKFGILPEEFLAWTSGPKPARFGRFMIQSAGILLYRRRRAREVFLVHPGGPFWRAKDLGAWSIPKGVISANEDPLAAARREFLEETGARAEGEARALGSFRISSGKELQAWAVEGEFDPAKLISNRFSMVWPPKGGTLHSFPEVDRGQWFKKADALARITKGQKPLLEKFFARDPGTR
jgi:predicted NUDIX family NTP pyrophosphohydrolase